MSGGQNLWYTERSERTLRVGYRFEALMDMEKLEYRP